MADIIITVVSGETTELGLSIPGVQGPAGADTMPSGGVAGNLLVKQSSVNYDATWTTQASGITLNDSTFSGATIQGVFSGGTYVASVISGATIDLALFNGGAADGTSVSNAIIDACSIDNSTIEDSVIFDVTVSGTVSAGSGLVLGNVSDKLAFYGSSAVVQPSGIAIPSGGASLAEVNTAVSGIITALTSLGLLA